MTELLEWEPGIAPRPGDRIRLPDGIVAVVESVVPPLPDHTRSYSQETIDQYRQLTARNVQVVALQCLHGGNYSVDDTPETAVVGRGIRNSYLYHRDKLEQCRPIIEAWLDQLHPQFHAGTGDGWSFLNACETVDGVLWGEHVDVEQMMCLGLALGKIEYCMGRELWDALPGGMPYFMVLNEGQPQDKEMT